MKRGDPSCLLPVGKDILNPLFKDARWDLSGLFVFDDSINTFIDKAKRHLGCKVPIESVHGCFPLMWNCGRVGRVSSEVWDRKSGSFEKLFERYRKYRIGVYLTFSNQKLGRSHLSDPSCNYLLERLWDIGGERNGVIVSSDCLSRYIRRRFPSLKQKASIVKVSCEKPRNRSVEYYRKLENTFDKIMIHPDDNLNFSLLEKLAVNPDRYEILVNENCGVGCKVRHKHYDYLARMGLEPWHGAFHYVDDGLCSYDGGELAKKCLRVNYFSETDWTDVRTCNLTFAELKRIYDMGFRHFKLQGRKGSAYAFMYDVTRYILEPDYIVPLFMKSIHWS